MTAPSARSLLRELARKSYPERSKHLWALGRQEAGSAALETLFNELNAADFYSQSLALILAAAAGEAARVGAGLSHPNLGLRRQALALARRLPMDDAVLEHELLAGAPDQRRMVAQLVRRSRRTSLAERIIAQVRQDRGDPEAAALLPACSAATVATLLPEIEHAVINWASLARRHPSVVLAHLTTALRAARPSRRDALWRRYEGALGVLAEREPRAVLDLLLTSGPSHDLPPSAMSRLGVMTRREPEMVVDLLCSARYRRALATMGLPRPVLKNLRFIPDAAQERLAAAVASEPGFLAQLLEALAPSDRAEVFTTATTSTSTPETLWPAALLEVLPHELRWAEVRRMLTLPLVRQSEEATLTWTSFLSPEEARPALEAAARRSRAEDRARGYELLIQCASRSRDPVALTHVLTVASRLDNDQDPVRLAAVSALAAVPPQTVREDHVLGLRRLVLACVEARDTSVATLLTLSRLAIRLLRAGATPFDDGRTRFALETLQRLATRSGSLDLAGLRHSLPKGAEGVLLDSLLDQLRGAERRDKFALVLRLAEALGRRAWDLTRLQELVSRATKASNDGIARQAVSLWLADPRSRSSRVDELLAWDKSTISLPPVLSHLHRRRQDLLDPFVRGSRIRGRFLSGRTVYGPVLSGGFHRWLPRQCLAYLKLLKRLADDKGRPMWERTRAVSAMAAFPEVGFSAVQPYVGSADVFIAEAALGGLAHTDYPERALPILFENLGSDRARVAVYAAGRCARFVSPDELGRLLSTLLATEGLKITVRKETLRLAALHRVPGAMDLLASEWARPNLHVDLRIAVGWGARRLLEHPEAWRILEGLAQGGPDEALSLVAGDPLDLAAVGRPRYGRLVMTLASHLSESVSLQAFKVLAAWGTDPDEAAVPAATALVDLDSGPRWEAAAVALVELTVDAGHLPALAGAVGRLVREAPLDDDPTVGRDLPRRQRVTYVTQQLVGLKPEQRSLARPTIGEVAASLGSDPTLLDVQEKLRLSLAEWGSPEAMAAVLQTAHRWDLRPAGAHALGTWLRQHLDAEAEDLEPRDLLPTVEALMAEPGSAASVFALALVAAAGRLSGWVAPWPAFLRRMRGHSDPDLASAARSTIIVSEGVSSPLGGIPRRAVLRRWGVRGRIPPVPAWRFRY